MGHLTTDDKVQKFFETYSAHFGKLTKNDGVGIYEEWLRSASVDIDIAIKVLDRIADNWDRKLKPRLGQIKRVMQECRYEERQERTTERRYVVPDCDMCGNTGKIWVVVGVIDGQRYFINDGNRERAGDMQIREHPCQCPRGIEQNFILFEQPTSFAGYTNIAKLLKLGWKKWFKDQDAAKTYAARAAHHEPAWDEVEIPSALLRPKNSEKTHSDT